MNATADKFTTRQGEVLEVALAIIGASGIEALTMKNIGRRLGLTDAALYRHFAGKSEILGGVVALFEASSDDALRRIVASRRTGLAKVRAFFLDRCGEFAARRGLALVMFSDDIFKNDKKVMNRIHAIMEGHRRLLLTAVTAGQKCGEIRRDLPAEHVFVVVMGALRLLVRRWHGAGFGFDLAVEGQKLWRSLETLLKEEK